jgi:hypothetical protein
MAELPRLIGTPRQVAWATTIRQRFLAMMAEQLRETKSHVAAQSFGYRPMLEIHLASQRQIFASIGAHAQARYWIERRSLSLPQLAAAELRALNARPAVPRPDKKPPTH